MHILGTTRTRTTSYHPQANGLVERFHRQLKTALKTQPNAEAWTDSLPLVLLGIRTALKEDLQCTAAELVYGVPLRLPGDFFSPSPLPVSPDENYITRLKQYMGTLRAIPPRLTTNHNSFIDSSLNSATHVFVRRDSVRKPLQKPYDGPFRVISRSDKHFDIDLNGRKDTVSIDCLKAAHLDDSCIVVTSTPLEVPPPVPPTSNSSPAPLTHTRSGRRVRFPALLDL
jgi:hypothetical protein